MKARHHMRLLALATLVWAGFLLIGLPAYYQQYSPELMAGFDLLVLLPISIVLYVVLKPVPITRRMSLAVWIAFYFTIPLAVYDYVYCGLVLDHGIGFLWEYWYLTVYYVIPWLLAPAIVLVINRVVEKQPVIGESVPTDDRGSLQ
jgi:hypothetical protein